MDSDNDYFLLSCPACGWREECGHEAVLRWLRAARKVRPGREPEPEILHEVFLGSARQWACPECRLVGLHAEPLDEGGDWPGSRLCDGCRQPLSAERIAALPHVRLCPACQRKEEAGGSNDEVEYCPRCGAPMALRLAPGGGVTRYVMACTACRRA